MFRCQTKGCSAEKIHVYCDAFVMQCSASFLSTKKSSHTMRTPACSQTPDADMWYPVMFQSHVRSSKSKPASSLILLVQVVLANLLEDLSAVLEAALLVLAAVDKVGVVEGQLNSTVDDGVHGLYTQHERVVLVTDFVTP